MAYNWKVLINHLYPTDPTDTVGSVQASLEDPLIGVELEIERARYIKLTPKYMYTEEDGSLRHGGIEFITVPLAASELKATLHTFFEINANEISESNYSDRCSIHVHMNVKDISLEQLSNLYKLYLLYEPHLFNFAGEDRDNNIFCTPLTETAHVNTQLLQVGDHDPLSVIARFGEWVKYTALNLRPILDIGTIEFRHMPGTSNVEKIHNWIDLLVLLYTSACCMESATINNAIKSLNSNSQYHVFTRTIFRDKADLIISQPNFVDDMYKGIMYCKRGMI